MLLRYDWFMSIRPQDKALAEMILFITERSEGDERFGAVKLNKLLFYADFLAYLNLGSPITGQQYHRLIDGPAPRRILQVRQQLIDDGSLAIRKAEALNRNQERTFALREADLRGFTSEQIAIVTQIIDSSWNRTAAEVTALYDQLGGWEVVKIGATIPYEVAWASKRPPTEKERRRALQDREKAREMLAGVLVR